jgi:antitoxin HigA-1
MPIPANPNHRPTLPGELLQSLFLEDMALTQSELAAHLGWSKSKVSEIVTGRRRITLEIALALGDVLGNSAEFWLNAQKRVDLWQARQKPRKHYTNIYEAVMKQAHETRTKRTPPPHKAQKRSV